MGHDTPLAICRGERWLAELIGEATAQNACVTWGCTTCSARAFRQALWASAEANAKGVLVEELAAKLGMLPLGIDTTVVRLVLCELNARITSQEMTRLAKLFEAGPAGAIYGAMAEHEAALHERRREHEALNDPIVAQRGGAKTAARAAAHAVRLAAKAVRDAERARPRGE
jgi:hypothetical protein